MRRIKEWVDAGVLGDVSEAITWTNRPNDPWFVPPEGFPPPTTSVPETLDWDLWQGPVAHREFSEAHAPTRWRGWWDYGCGSLGDIGCHTFDAPFWALNLGSHEPQQRRHHWMAPERPLGQDARARGKPES
jgi:predicted dehydrogenase